MGDAGHGGLQVFVCVGVATLGLLRLFFFDSHNAFSVRSQMHYLHSIYENKNKI